MAGALTTVCSAAGSWFGRWRPIPQTPRLGSARNGRGFWLLVENQNLQSLHLKSPEYGPPEAVAENPNLFGLDLDFYVV